MKKGKTHTMKSLLSIMLRIGTFGFGGGTALIPVIEEEVTKNNKLINDDEFNKDVIIANITPGALPVEIASGIGRKIRGIRGMLLSALMMALPGALFTVLIISLINQSSSLVLKQILFASAGVTAYIIFMLHEYLKNTITACRDNNIAVTGAILVFLVFILTAEKEIYQIFALNITPIFDISTVQILIIAFFIIFYTNGKFNIAKISVSAIITILYCLCVGKSHIINIPAVVWSLRGIMIVLAIYGIITGIDEKPVFAMKPFKRFIKEEFAWFILLFIFSLPALWLCSDTISFIGKGVISVLMSFGGGDAYLAVADGLFIDSGIISYGDFYSKIASVANALPGSILCKILAGVGYYVGYNDSGVITGLCVAISGFVCSVAASSGTFSAMAYIYERFEKLSIFQALKIYIRPIVAGLLLTVSLSMFCQNISIAETEKIPAISIIAVTFVIYLLNIYWKSRQKLKPIMCVLISAVISLALCNVFS